MAKLKAYALTGLKLHEVSLVDRGAVKRKFALTKRRHGANMAKTRKDDGTGMSGAPPGQAPGSDDGDNEILDQLLDTPMSNEADISQALSGMSDDARNAAIGAMRILSGYADQFQPSDYQTMLSIVSGEPPPDPSTDPSSDDPSNSDGAGKQTSRDAQPPPQAPAPSDNDDDKNKESEMTDTTKAEFSRLEKAHRDELARVEKAAEERARKAEAKTEAIEKQLAEQRDLAESKACIEKAEKEFPNCGDSATIGQLLKDATGKSREALEQHLRATEARLKTSDLFKTAGHNRANPAPGTALDEMNKATAELMKSDSKLKWSQAMDKVLARDPALYHRYEAEKAAR